MKIRQIKPKDKEEFIKLVKIAFEGNRKWAVQKFQKYIPKAGKAIFVAEIKKKLVGYIGIEDKEKKDLHLKEARKILGKKTNYTYIPFIAVHPNYRKKGIGLSLLFYCENYVKMKMKKGIWLDCRKKLLYFYEQAGYKIEGKFKDKGRYRYILTKKIS